jgi:hypothetical protein
MPQSVVTLNLVKRSCTSRELCRVSRLRIWKSPHPSFFCKDQSTHSAYEIPCRSILALSSPNFAPYSSDPSNQTVEEQTVQNLVKRAQGLNDKVFHMQNALTDLYRKMRGVDSSKSVDVKPDTARATYNFSLRGSTLQQTEASVLSLADLVGGIEAEMTRRWPAYFNNCWRNWRKHNNCWCNITEQNSIVVGATLLSRIQ